MKTKTTQAVPPDVRRLLWGTVLALATSHACAQDPELTNYKSGISLRWSGTKGVDYKEEYLYHDKLVSDHKVVYLRAGTRISMSHNERNIAGKASGADAYEAVGTEVGQIRYKVDGDQRWELYPHQWSAYQAPFSFAELNYGLYGDPGVAVLGSTGDNGVPLTVENKLSRYHRGMIGPAGDEWHTLTVADDDRGYSTSTEFQSSDGKIFLFVVDPKTPCLTWRASGSGEFYTTPAKKYFVPHIYDQTTYFFPGANGSVEVEIDDINGNQVFYRIVADPADASTGFTAAGGKAITLGHAAFPPGTSYLQYYYAGREDHVKTRRCVKNPAYPSENEVHGDRLWINAEYWENEVSQKISPWWLDQWRTNDFYNKQSTLDGTLRRGLRDVSDDYTAFINALVARHRGMTAKRSSRQYSFAEYAKFELLESPTILDPVGGELNTSERAIPAREIIYRGYYDVRQVYAAAAAYDILIGYFRANQGHPNGITAIEDHFIRDSLARWVHYCGMTAGGWGAPAYYAFDSGGMWDTARKTGAAFIACMMPTYSTEYYGTCGLDGNTETFDDHVFPTVNYTWRSLFIDNNVEPTGFPDLTNRMGVHDYLFTPQGQWTDRILYANTPLMGQCMGIYYNLLKLFAPGRSLPNYDAGMARAARGELVGLKQNIPSDSDPVFYSWTILCNAWHPEFRAVAQPRAEALPSSDGQHPSKQRSAGGPFTVLWYDVDLPLGSGAPAMVAPPTFSVPGGEYEQPQSVAIATSTPGATIRYTLDGSQPSAGNGSSYSGPVAIGAGATTLRAVAIKSGLQDSPVRSASYAIGSTVATPTATPGGGDYLEPVAVTLATATAGATIHYTLDGSAPDGSSPSYAGPVTLDASAELRAIALKAGSEPSGVLGENYSVGRLVSSNSEWHNLGLGRRVGELSLECEVVPGINALVALATDEADNWPELAAIVRFAPDRTIDARDGGTYRALVEVPYEQGQRYKLVVGVDLEAHTYSVRVTPPGGNPIEIARDFAFRTEQAEASELNFLTSWTQVGTTVIDGITMSDTLLAAPGPPSGEIRWRLVPGF